MLIFVSINAVFAWFFQPCKRVDFSAWHSYRHDVVLCKTNYCFTHTRKYTSTNIHCQNDANSIEAKPKNLYFSLKLSLYFESHVSDNLSGNSCLNYIICVFKLLISILLKQYSDFISLLYIMYYAIRIIYFLK